MLLRLLHFLVLASLPGILFCQISGVVLDENGEGLPFAAVYVQNSTKGVTANAEGAFRLPLEPGTYDIVFHYIGYEQAVEKIKVPPGGVQYTIRLVPSVLEISEVIITGEDPAMGIMRSAISRREYNKKRITDYSCDVYIKGFHKMLDAPKKILGQDIGNMGGILDSARTGVLYLSESVSKLYVQTDPAKKKEVMISSKVSGDDNGFNVNRATLMDFNLYDERIEIEREILSPLADNAFNYYAFRLDGSFVNQDGYKIYKIAVLPKRPADPSFSGHLYVVDNWYNLAGVDLYLSGSSIKQPILDTLQITQEFVSVERPDKWCLLSQVTGFRFGILGFKIKGSFNSVFSNYNISPIFDQGLFNREEFRIDQTAGEKDSLYWSVIRPVPLTSEEQRDYVVKDSLRQIWESKEYLDSIDRKDNKFKPLDLIMGYSWENSYKKIRLEWPAAFRWVQFNTVQGWLVNIEPTYRKFDGERRSRYWRAKGNLNYGFEEQKLRGGLQLERQFESIHYTHWGVSGGQQLFQLDGNAPVGPLINSLYSLIEGQNFMKLYEKAYFGTDFSRILAPGVGINAGLEYQKRSPVLNHSDFTWYKGEPRFTANSPFPGDSTNNPWFTSSQALMLEVGANFRFGVTYSSYPNFRSYSDSKWPTISVRFRQAIPIGEGGPNYLFGQLQAGMRAWTWGLIGYSNWSVSTGGFLYKKQAQFMDAYHPLANQTLFYQPRMATQSFMMMPYYTYSSYQPFVEVHWQHHFQGFLLDKVPGLRKLNWKEVLTVNAFYSEKKAMSIADSSQAKPWLELGFGFENIGIKLFRPLHLDVVNSFEGTQYSGTRLLIGLEL